MSKPDFLTADQVRMSCMYDAYMKHFAETRPSLVQHRVYPGLQVSKAGLVLTLTVQPIVSKFSHVFAIRHTCPAYSSPSTIYHMASAMAEAFERSYSRVYAEIGEKLIGADPCQSQDGSGIKGQDVEHACYDEALDIVGDIDSVMSEEDGDYECDEWGSDFFAQPPDCVCDQCENPDTPLCDCGSGLCTDCCECHDPENYCHDGSDDRGIATWEDSDGDDDNAPWRESLKDDPDAIGDDWRASL